MTNAEKFFSMRSDIREMQAELVKKTQDLEFFKNCFVAAQSLYLSAAKQAGKCPACLRKIQRCKCVVQATPGGNSAA